MDLRKLMSVCVVCLCSLAASAQLKIIPKERLDSIANPPLAANAELMKFERTRIEAGRMEESRSPVTFEYAYANVGKTPIAVSRLVSSCSCAVAWYDRAVVEPGHRGIIYVRYNPAGHPGKFERRVFVYTDDNIQPSAVLKLSVEVEETN